MLTIVATGKVVNARNNETRKRAIKAFKLNLEVRITIAIILIPTNTDFSKTIVHQL